MFEINHYLSIYTNFSPFNKYEERQWFCVTCVIIMPNLILYIYIYMYTYIFYELSESNIGFQFDIRIKLFPKLFQAIILISTKKSVLLEKSFTRSNLSNFYIAGIK